MLDTISMNKNIPLTTVVQNLYAAFARGDITTLLAGLREDVRWGLNVEPAAPGASAVPTFRACSGRVEVAEFFAGLGRDLEFHTFAPQSFTAGAREVACLLVIETTVRATGRRVRVESLHHFSFDETGLVSRFREFTDTLAVAAAWGKITAA